MKNETWSVKTMGMLWAVVYNFQQGENYQDRDVETKIYTGTIHANCEDTIKQFYKDVEFSDPRSFLKDGDRVYYTIRFVLFVEELNVFNLSDYGWSSSSDDLDEWYVKYRKKYADPEFQQYLKLKERFGDE